MLLALSALYPLCMDLRNSDQLNSGCVLILLHEMLWVFPPTQRVAPLPVWRVIGAHPHSIDRDTKIRRVDGTIRQLCHL